MSSTEAKFGIGYICRMNLRGAAAAIVFLTCRAGQTQTITVVDRISREPLPGVVIYNTTKTQQAISDAKGHAELGGFSQADTLWIQMVGYRSAAVPRTQLVKTGIAELEADNLTLQEVVVAANRWEEQANETPNRISIIRRKDAELQNPQTTADLLETGGHVFIQKSQLAGGSPMLRGFATNRVMLVVDGVRMNNAIFRSGNLQNVISIDAHALQSTEVLFGPGAVMYGSDAIGGVMDFHTLRPRFSDSAGMKFIAGNMVARYSSANSERTAHADVNISGKRWSWLGSFTRSDYSDLRAGTAGNPYYLRPTYVMSTARGDTMIRNSDPTVLAGTGFSQTNIMQKLSARLSKSLTAEYAFHYSETSNAPRYDRLYLDEGSDGILDFAQWYYGPQKWMMHRLSVTDEAGTMLYDKARILISRQNYEESRHDRRFGSTRLRSQNERVLGTAVNIDLDKRLSSRLTLFYGAEVVHNRVRSSAFSTNIHSKEKTAIITRYPDKSTWLASGAYINVKYSPAPRIHISAGARYSYYVIRAAFDTTFLPLPFTEARNNNGALNGAAGISFLPDHSARFYLNAATGFRAPNIDDLGKVFESEPGSLVVPNNNLVPEYAYNAEAGFVKIFGRRLKVDGALYYTWLRNALARRPFTLNGADSVVFEGELSAVQAIQNMGHAFVYGVQAGIEMELPAGFGVSGKFSWQQGQERAGDQAAYYPKPHVPPAFGRADVLYNRRKLRVNLYAVWNAAMSYDELSFTDRHDHVPFAKDQNGKPFVPAWYTLNLKVAWYAGRNLAVTGGVENITDRLYRPFASGISAPGRNYIIGVKAKI